MPMTVRKAESAFDRTLNQARRLLEVNDYVNWPRGTPARQQALYRGVVVLTVGAWQSVVEDIALATFEITKKRAKDAGLALSALVGPNIDKFNTPNKTNTLALLGVSGLGLPASWSILSAGATLTDQQSWETIDAWLQVRHSVAHGFPFSESAKLTNLLTSCPHVAARVLTGRAPRGQQRALRFDDAHGCIELFANVSGIVVGAAQSYKARP